MAKCAPRRQPLLALGPIAHNMQRSMGLEGSKMTDSNRNKPPPVDATWPGIRLVGLGIVIVGVIFLARNFGGDSPLAGRWWALFVLTPAGGALVTAARLYNQDGRLSERVIGAATV